MSVRPARALRFALAPTAVRGFVLTLALAAAAAHAEAPVWSVVPAQSSVTFVATQQGEKFTGVFGTFTARIQFAPADAASSRLEATLQMASATTRSAERDDALASSAWFDSAHYPVTNFRTVAVRAAATGTAGGTADADLTIKGRTRRIVFPFGWEVRPGGAVLDARVTLNRLDFGVGAGEWADASIIGHKVEVIVHLVLVPATGH